MAKKWCLPDTSVKEWSTSLGISGNHLVVDQVLGLADYKRVAAIVVDIRVESINHKSTLIAELDTALGTNLLQWLS